MNENECEHKWRLVNNDFIGDRNVPYGMMRLAPYLKCVECDEIEHDVKENWPWPDREEL